MIAASVALFAIVNAMACEPSLNDQMQMLYTAFALNDTVVLREGILSTDTENTKPVSTDGFHADALILCFDNLINEINNCLPYTISCLYYNTNLLLNHRLLPTLPITTNYSKALHDVIVSVADIDAQLSCLP